MSVSTYLVSPGTQVSIDGVVYTGGQTFDVPDLVLSSGRPGDRAIPSLPIANWIVNGWVTKVAK